MADRGMAVTARQLTYRSMLVRCVAMFRRFLMFLTCAALIFWK
jgi:hypothetical protein